MKKANMFIIAVMALVIINCNGNGSDDPDAGDTDTTPTCADVTNILANADFRVCIDDPNHAEVDLAIANAPTELMTRLAGMIKEGTYNQCTIFAIRESTVPSDAFGEDDDGAQVDADNPTHKSLSGLHIDQIPCANPVDESGAYNQVVPLKDIRIEIPDTFGTVYRWNPDMIKFEIVAPTVISSTGLAYESKEFSDVFVFNRPFYQFEVNYVTDGEGYDVNEDGVLFQVTLSDEGQEQFPVWVAFEAKEGETSLEITPITGEPTQFRVKVPDTGEHTISISVRDTNNIVSKETDQHEASVADTIDLTEELCDGVTCGDNATCDPSDGLCYCDTGYEGDPYVECTDYDACTPNPCFTGVTCTDDPPPSLGYDCGDCPTGYVGDGETCVCDTANGYYDDGLGGCVNPCDADPCGLSVNGDTCTPSDWDVYVCTCDVGWDPMADCATCASGYGGVNCDAIPTITNIVIDCSNPGICLPNWTANPYPVTFDTTDATTCSVVLSLESGSSSLGSTSPCIITGDSGSFDYDSTGTSGPATIRMTITVFGPGGQATDYDEISW